MHGIACTHASLICLTIMHDCSYSIASYYIVSQLHAGLDYLREIWHFGDGDHLSSYI